MLHIMRTISALVIASILTPATAYAQALVKVTPLGSHAGELCARDRALLFEDPTGARILYDPGFMVDETDPRLGDVHVILLTHAHSDHIGTRRDRGGTCAAPAMGPTNTNSNVASIAALKNAVVMTTTETGTFLALKIQSIRGAATAPCQAAGVDSETTVPVAAPCTASIGVGGSRLVRRGGASDSVRITGVQAAHPNNIPEVLFDPPGPPAGTSPYGGLALGFVIRFTNGLTAYLTGDTGLFGDMGHVIARFYRPNLVVMNIGPGGNGPTAIGPEDAANAIGHLVRPTTVMPSHVGEQATSGGALRANTGVDRFVRDVREVTTVVLPVSDVTLAFDGEGRCTGCRR
jgi:L-ascorbate metabolism protein UlaG (beta-lactamase superfamily)